MSKSTDKSHHETIQIPLPEELFDAPDAVVRRRKRVSVALVNKIRQLARGAAGESLWQALADVYPAWEGVCDVDTGEALPNPQEDPLAFIHLDYTEQVAWFIQDGLAYSPNRQRKAA